MPSGAEPGKVSEPQRPFSKSHPRFVRGCDYKIASPSIWVQRMYLRCLPQMACLESLPAVWLAGWVRLPPHSLYFGALSVTGRLRPCYFWRVRTAVLCANSPRRGGLLCARVHARPCRYRLLYSVGGGGGASLEHICAGDEASGGTGPRAEPTRPCGALNDRERHFRACVDVIPPWVCDV